MPNKVDLFVLTFSRCRMMTLETIGYDGQKTCDVAYDESSVILKININEELLSVVWTQMEYLDFGVISNSICFVRIIDYLI